MKRMVLFWILPIIALGLLGCNTRENPQSPSLDETAYITAYVLDVNKKELYSSNTKLEDIPVLDLITEYYLQLHVGPGSRFLPYFAANIMYNEDEVIVRELSGCEGELYIIRGVKECISSEIEIVISLSTVSDDKVKCNILLSFS